MHSIARRSLPLIVSLALLLGLGAVGLVLVDSAREGAETVYRRSTFEKQRAVASLTEQYVLLAAREVRDWGRRTPLTLTPGDPGDRAALERLMQESPLVDYGAALTDVTGRTLNAFSRGSGLPPAGDPGYAPLREALLRGKPGVSSVMTVTGIDVVAVAVPVMGTDGTPRAILTGFFQANISALQTYSETLKERNPANAYVVDQAGRIVASRQGPGEVGRLLPPSPVLEALRTGQPGVRHFPRDGVEMVGGYAPIGETGLGLIEELDAATYYGSLRSDSQATTVALIILLLVGAVTAFLLHQRAERARLRGHRRAEALLREAGDVTTVMDADARVIYTSPAVERVLGFAPADCLGRSAFEWVHPDDEERMRGLLAELVDAGSGQFRTQARVLQADGGYVPCDMTLTNGLADPDVRGLVLNLRDIAQLMALHDELTRQALHDPLTELPNRTLLDRRITERMTRQERPGTAAVLFIDLDGFKKVNDTKGHEAGDALLVEVARRLRQCVREHDTVARMGGDEFVVFLDGVEGADGAAKVAARVLERLRAPFAPGDDAAAVSASIGIAMAQAGQTVEQLLRDADEAMYRAKNAGKSQYQLSAA